MARTSPRDASREAVIGRSARVRGRISGDGDLTVEGSVEGDIALRGDLVLGEAARAESNVDANAVTVRGQLDGDIHARGGVRIEAGARVRGDVQGESISIEEGAEFTGRLEASVELPPELGGAGGGRRR